MWLKRGCTYFFKFRQFCTHASPRELTAKANVQFKNLIPEPEYNIEFLCNPSNRDVIFNNIQARKASGNIDKILELSQNPESEESLLNELKRIPNQTDPAILHYGREPRVLKECGRKPEFDFDPQNFDELFHKLKLIKTKTLGPVIGERAYVLLGDLAQMEESLVHYTVRKLMNYGFKLVSVPDIIPTKIIERCGLLEDQGRTLVYNLDSSHGDDYSLSGTSEMALAYKLMNNTFSYEELPLKIAAVSRCFRAETSSTSSERGIYRVHQFTKVEMFVCSEQEKSIEQFQELQAIQEDLFSSLNIHFQIVDMPPHELGAPAYRKIDIEGWMPGKKWYGELSSCSNCTDYQSRRLSIKYKSKSGDLLHVHTLNGTACAIPRMLIAVCETHQTKDGLIKVPENLVSYMNGKTLIRQQPIASMRKCNYKQKL